VETFLAVSHSGGSEGAVGEARGIGVVAEGRMRSLRIQDYFVQAIDVAFGKE